MYSKTYIVYMHLNKINHKKYFGFTGTTLKHRFGKNGIGYAKCPIFNNAIKKYGWDNFRHIVLARNLTLDKAKQLEIYLINKFNTTDLRYGYNFSSGGGGANGISPSKETREKISKSNTGIAKDVEWRKHLSESLIGRKFSDKHIENLKKSHIGKCGVKHPRSRPVLQINLQTKEVIAIYESANLAAKAIGRDSGGIISACKGKRKSCGGFGWLYSYENINLK